MPKPEASVKLEAYATLLLKWNARINLVAASTLPELRERHIEDSAQLFDRLPAATKIVADLGSGAGFPGLVLACLAQTEGRATRFHLIESDGRKAVFLQEAIRVMELINASVHLSRVEQVGNLAADVVTARAFSSLTSILQMGLPLAQKEHLFLLLKGCKAETEIEEARAAGWNFTATAHSSSTDPEGRVLEIREVKHT